MEIETSAPEERDFPLGVRGFRYADLYRPDRLAVLHRRFLQELRETDPALADSYDAWAAAPRSLTPEQISDVIVRTAPHLSSFLARLFDVGRDQEELRLAIEREGVVQRFKDAFVRRRTLKRKPEEGAALRPELPALAARARRILETIPVAPSGAPDEELDLACRVVVLVDLEAALKKAARPGAPAVEPAVLERIDALRAALPADSASAIEARDRFLGDLLDALDRWLCARRADPVEGAALRSWVSLRVPGPIDHHALVRHVRPDPALPELLVGPHEHRRQRGDFKLTDRRKDMRQIQWEADYCVFCHERDRDSCAKGVREKDGKVRLNPLGIPLAGCPLDEKIGEMQILRHRGDSIAALATVMIDNPMLPGTGHRICNDCMKACIYQKQEPVDIPQVETAVLTDVLRLPWGFEIYSLLTRWNPLDVRRPHMLPYNGKNVLVVGLGPAGYTLAQHLLADGYGVAGVDGLKIEPLPEPWTGRLREGVLPRAIRDFSAEVERELDDRVLVGFGGVAEYGITVRWDKNFLTVLHITLSRRDLLSIHGGVRFGGTITIEDAWAMGFDHIAIATGAGKPTIVGMKNNLIRGVRKASDFLMALQLTGAFKADALANLQLRLPAVVIGGGLTGIDTATEALAYYVVQCEKFLSRWETLAAEAGEDPRGPQPPKAAGVVEKLLAAYDREEREIAQELLGHGRRIREEKAVAAREGRPPRLQELLASWGGVTLAYRRAMTDSPAYRLNHEEVVKCLEEGVRFLELMSPVEAVPDEHGAVAAIRFERQVPRDGKLAGSGEIVELPARAVLVAAGTSPNIVYEREHPGTFQLDERRQFFQAHRLDVGPDGARTLVPVPRGEGFFTSWTDGKRHVTFYGDNHPKYAGSVVKAMASARDGAAVVRRLFEDEIAAQSPADQGTRDEAWRRLVGRLEDDLVARVHQVIRLTPTIVEVVIRAPLAARKFRPGQFYRLQNYEMHAPQIDGQRLTMEGIALTGAWVDVDQGLLSLIVLEMGGSSRLCAALSPGEPVVVMGPTGAPTEIPRGQDVVLVGGGLGNAVLFSIARALRNAGCRVLYFAGYKKPIDVYHMDDIEAGCDQVIWSVDVPPAITPRRPQDRTFLGNIVQAMLAHARGELGECVVPLRGCKRLIAIGSDRMMSAVARARHEVLAEHLDPGHVGIGSINSTMQCMMKEVCAQCLQKHRDPRTGEERVVFSCFDQDQPLDRVDWQNLASRLRTNSVQEKLTSLWLDHLLSRESVVRV